MEYFMSVAVMIAIFVILGRELQSGDRLRRAGHGRASDLLRTRRLHRALLAIHTGLPALLCVLAGAIVAVAARAARGVGSLRVSGDYLLIASLGFQLGLLQVIREFRMDRRSRRTDRHSNHHHRSLRERRPIWRSAGRWRRPPLAFIAWIVHGPYGRAITAMRDEELAFTALGRNAMSMKIALFAIGCGIAGIAGGLYAFYFQYLSPEQFDVLQSAAILTMVVLGGMGTTWGPVVGAVAAAGGAAGHHVSRSAAEHHGADAGHHLHRLWCCVFLFLRPAGLIGASGRGEMPAALAVHDHSGEGA